MATTLKSAAAAQFSKTAPLRILVVEDDAPRGYISLEEAVEFIPGRPHKGTLWRWATRGVRGEVLDTIPVGGRRMVTLTALDDFLFRLKVKGANGEQACKKDTRRGQAAGDALQRSGF